MWYGKGIITRYYSLMITKTDRGVEKGGWSLYHLTKRVRPKPTFVVSRQVLDFEFFCRILRTSHVIVCSSLSACLVWSVVCFIMLS